MNGPAVIYRKFNNGDPLSMDELNTGIKHFKVLENAAREAGPEFKLTANEARRVADALEGFHSARMLRR